MEKEKITGQEEQLSQESVCEDSQANQKNKDFEKEKEKYGGVFLESVAKTGGILAVFLAATFGCGMLYVIYKLIYLILTGIVALFNLCGDGYNKWFGDIEGRELGRNGIVYVYKDNTIMKTCPNRIVLNNINDVKCRENDTIGIVNQFGTYDLLNLNTAEYITNQEYDNMWRLDDETCSALKRDSLYTLEYTTGKVLLVEDASLVYEQLDAICREGESDAYVREAASVADKALIIAYIYTNYNGKKGLMSREFEKLTSAIYNDITPYAADVLYCEFGDLDESYNLYDTYEAKVGVFLNSKGERMKW